MLYFLFKTFLPIFYNHILTNYKSVCRIEFINQVRDQLAHLFSISANMRDR